MDKALDIVTIGDSSLDAFLEIHEASLHAKLDRGKGELSFRYGDKIPIENLHFLAGGNAANTAVGFSRLNLKTAIVTTLGSDEFSEKIINTLKREGVEARFIQKEPGSSSNFSVSITFQEERTLFTYHVKREYQLGEIPEADWIYLTSLGEYWQKVYEEVACFVKNNKVRLAFSPGSHQMEGDPALLREVLSLTKILFVNKQEGQRIVQDNTEDVRQLLLKLTNLGPQIVSLTDGINGSWARFKDGKIFTLGILPCNIIEKTGVGDAYASGFFSGLFYGLSAGTAMTWGAVNAASVIEKVGAQTGLLIREEIEKRLEDQPDFQTKELT